MDGSKNIYLIARDELFEPKKLGGGGRYVKAMSGLLPQIAKKEGIEIKALSLPKIKFVPNSMQSLIRSIIDNYDSRIIHNLVDCVIPKLNKKIVITTAHEFRELTLPYSDLKRKTFKENLYYYFLKNNTKRILSSDIIISNSSQTRAEALKLGFDNKKIFVVNHGIDKKFILAKLKHSQNKVFTVGYLDTIRSFKISLFIRTLPSLYKMDKNIAINIYGSPKGLSTYNFSVKELKILNQFILKKFVKLNEWVPENKIVEIYDSFDVFVHPSLYEGFGLPILEAQSRGLPVIIYKYAKIPKEVRKYCFEAESPEHIAQIIEHLKENGYNEKLRKEATEYARSFTWEKCARETFEVYKKVLKLAN